MNLLPAIETLLPRLMPHWIRLGQHLGLIGLLLSVTLAHPAPAHAQVSAFNCDGTLYVSRANTENDPTALNRVITDQPNPSPSLAPIGTDGVRTYNASGFRAQDGNIYAIRPNNNGAPGNSDPRNTIYQIGQSGTPVSIGVPAGLPNDNWFAGDFSPEGIYYIYSATSGQIFALNVDSRPPTVLGRGTVQGRPQLFDIAFNPLDGNAYGFDRQTNQVVAIAIPEGGGLAAAPAPPSVITPIRFSIAPGQSTANATAGVPGGAVGATFFDSFGRLFLYENGTPGGQNGNIYRTNAIDRATFLTGTLNTVIPLPFQNVDGVGNNDGAACPFAPIVEKTVNPNAVDAGSVVTYTYTVFNSNVVDLSNVRFIDDLGGTDGRTFVDGSLEISQLSGANLTVNAYGGSSQLEINGIDIPPGNPPNPTLSFSVQVQLNTTTTGTLFNQALVETSEARIINPATGGIGPPINPRVIAITDFPGTVEVFPDRTPLTVDPVAPNPQVGIAKQAGTLVVNPDRTFTIPYTLIIRNYGNVALSNVQIVEDLRPTFASPATFTIASPPTSPDGLTANAAFNGATTLNVLAGTDTLEVGAQRTVSFTVTVTPNGNFGPYNNTATVTATDPTGNPVTDISTDGNNPDPDGNTIPNEPTNQVPTVVQPPLADLSVTKGVNNANPAIGAPITYSIGLTNSGPSVATNVTVSENLPAGFTAAPPAGTTYAAGIWSVPSLAVGQTLTLQITGNYSGTPFTNVAQVATADQLDPDSIPGNNNRDEDDQAEVSVPAVEADLSLTKAIDNATPALGDTVTFTIILANAGPDTATNIQVSDPIPAGFTNVVARPEVGSFAEGIWRIPSLGVGQQRALRVSGTVSAASLTNVAQVSAVDQRDPDSTPNNNVPSEDDQATVTINAIANLSLVKRITAVTRNGTVTRFDNLVDNPINPDFVGITTISASDPLTSGDTLEYTIYYQGTGNLGNVQICDAVPANTSYLNGTLQVDPPGGTADLVGVTDVGDGDGGQFFAPLTPVPTPPCANAMNPNGTVFFTVGDVPSNAAGFVRFATQVQ